MNVAAAGATGSSRSRRFSAIVDRVAVVEPLSAAARGFMVGTEEVMGMPVSSPAGVADWAGESVSEPVRNSAPTIPTCTHCGGRYVLDEDGDRKCFSCGRSPGMPDEQRAMLMAEMKNLKAGQRYRKPIPGGVWRDLAGDGGAS